MKIINVTPGILPIPPNGWGATEKIIWEYHKNFLKLGYDSKILYLDDVKYDSDTIVHIHVANLALIAHERGIPYYFTCHDHHSYLYGKDSICFKENYDAIKYSIKSFVPAKYLVDYFNLPNLEYLSHGVNNEFFKPNNIKNTEHKLLCVANNGFIHNSSEDRKGFSFAIEAAKKLNLPITIAGPKNNKHFFDKNDFKYDKLNIVYDLDENELLSLYQKHTIFLHPSILEAGHPNLTLLEAMSCGLPTLATFEKNNCLDGLVEITRDVNDIVNSIQNVIINYEEIRIKSLFTSKLKSWENITNILLKKFMNDSMKDQLINIYKSTQINHKEPNSNVENKVIFNFNDTAKVEILGDLKKNYFIKFKNKSNDKIVYETEIKNNMWAAANISYYVDWNIQIKDLDTNNIKEYDLDLKNKKVRIVNESPSLGDFISWMSYVDLFQKKHACMLDFYTPHKQLFESSYPNINFYNYNDFQSNDYLATYRIGCFDFSSKEKSPVDFRTQNLQQIAAEILGFKYEEIKPIIKIKNQQTDINEKYVCISTSSTSGCKHWQNETGWQETVDYLNQIGYKVVVLQKEPLNYMDLKGLNNVIHPQTKTLDDVIMWLSKCEFYIGLSSGVSWLAWALNKKVIMISGFTKEFNEFFTPHRIINSSVCNGCWNDINHKFDGGDWNWCPRLKGTDRQFECTKTITFEYIKKEIDKIT